MPHLHDIIGILLNQYLYFWSLKYIYILILSSAANENSKNSSSYFLNINLSLYFIKIGLLLYEWNSLIIIFSLFLKIILNYSIYISEIRIAMSITVNDTTWHHIPIPLKWHGMSWSKQGDFPKEAKLFFTISKFHNKVKTPKRKTHYTSIPIHTHSVVSF